MSNLLIEIGNTSLKAVWSESMTLGKTFRYQGEKMLDYIYSLVEKEKPSVMVVASAILIQKETEEKLKNCCCKLVIIDANHTDELKDNKLPEYLSPDRAASIIAARYLFPEKGSIIFDFGTTLTIDIVESDGEYVGGNISLGSRTRFKALNRYSRNLPLVDASDIVRQTGDSIETSIEAGVMSGIMFEIQGYIALFPEKLIVFSGGDALYFAKRLKNSIFAICNLVQMGLAIIANKYGE